jgi:hypothetical protein
VTDQTTADFSRHVTVHLPSVKADLQSWQDYLDDRSLDEGWVPCDDANKILVIAEHLLGLLELVEQDVRMVVEPEPTPPPAVEPKRGLRERLFRR